MPKSPEDIHGNRLNDWQAKGAEPALDPEQPIIDAHHHLWDRRSRDDFEEATPTHRRYNGDDLLDDILRSGHNVIDTVFIECLAMYQSEGGPTASSGEVEYVQGIAAQAEADLFGKGLRCCGAIIGATDLTLGEDVPVALDSLVAAGRNFRGIRHGHGFHPSPDIPFSHHPTYKIEHLLMRDDFRAGFSELSKRGLLFECWGYHTQLSEVADLARSFPEVPIVLDHLGGPMAIGPYKGQRDTVVFEAWKQGVAEVASCSNVVAKLGGAGMPIFDFGFQDASQPPASSTTLAAAWKPHFEFVLNAFGIERCMFESNFPVDKVSVSYGNLWNAFKRIATGLGLSADEKNKLFYANAAKTYSMALPVTLDKER